jgi:hypothetical protein
MAKTKHKKKIELLTPAGAFAAFALCAMTCTVWRNGIVQRP